MKSSLRWLALIPACVGVWYLTLALGIVALEVPFWFCPAEQIISGACTASWFPASGKALFLLFAGLSAFGVVAVAMAVAPSHKIAAGCVAFLVGAVLACFLTIAAAMWAELFTALVFGALALILAHRLLRDR